MFESCFFDTEWLKLGVMSLKCDCLRENVTHYPVVIRIFKLLFYFISHVFWWFAKHYSVPRCATFFLLLLYSFYRNWEWEDDRKHSSASDNLPAARRRKPPGVWLEPLALRSSCSSPPPLLYPFFFCRPPPLTEPSCAILPPRDAVREPPK